MFPFLILFPVSVSIFLPFSNLFKLNSVTDNEILIAGSKAKNVKSTFFYLKAMKIRNFDK